MLILSLLSVILNQVQIVEFAVFVGESDTPWAVHFH